MVTYFWNNWAYQNSDVSIRHAKLKQRNLVVTLIDLKNAFGEVHHQLIRKTLSFHDIPDSMIYVIICTYDDFYLSFTSKKFIKNRINRGVLQGDCLSPLLFNQCINILLNTVKNEKLNCFGFVYGFYFKPRNWFQFTDDTAIVISPEEDNQLFNKRFYKMVHVGRFISSHRQVSCIWH